MKDGPDISRVALLMGDPARANMLMALMSGMALTAKELAQEAGVTASTASSHLSQLKSCGLVSGRKQGRFRYFHIADRDVAQAVEALVTVAARAGHLRSRPGPRDARMREARSCYDHLAGRLAVDLFSEWMKQGILASDDEEATLTEKGRAFLHASNIDVGALAMGRRPLCRTCLDWSERRSHLGGSLGAAVFSLMLEKGWAKRVFHSRALVFDPRGERDFVAWYCDRRIS